MAMGSGLNGTAMLQVARVLRDGTLAGMSDRQILERFVESRDEIAFEAIVTRHGPMVRRVCQQMLFNPHDVDDAVQAVFLVLVRKARFIRIESSLGPWLYAVAGRVAARARAVRRRRWEREGANIDQPEPITCASSERFEVDRVIHDELGRLPERLRAPLVLCYLDGLTHDLAARQLECPVGTVRSRLARGRDLLHRRILRRGLTLSTATLAGILESNASAAVGSRLPAPFAAALKRAMLETVRCEGVGISSSFAAIPKGVLHMSPLKSITILGMLIPASLIAFELTRRTAAVGHTAVPNTEVGELLDDDGPLIANVDGIGKAPANGEKPPALGLPAEPIEPYLLTKESGPFMVLARVFRGPDAQRWALTLAKELRSEYGLPAYIFQQKKKPGAQPDGKVRNLERDCGACRG